MTVDDVVPGDYLWTELIVQGSPLARDCAFRVVGVERAPSGRVRRWVVELLEGDPYEYPCRCNVEDLGPEIERVNFTWRDPGKAGHHR